MVAESLIVVVGLLAGVAVGWFLATRPLAELRQRLATRDAEARGLEERFRAAITELAGATERATRVDGLAEELAAARERHGEVLALLRREHEQMLDGLRVRLAAREAELATLREKTANFDEQKRLLIAAQDEMRKQFELAGTKVLDHAQKVLLERAQERFAHSEKASKEAVAALLAPVSERLKTYEEQVKTLETARVDAFGQLTGQIEAMRVGQEQVRAEAARLGNSLRNAPKARGRWGEQQLRNVLEQCGLAEHTDFVTEQSVNTEEGRLRPDAVITIPGQKQLVIDAKVSLNAYQDAFEAEDEESRKRFLDLHAASMRAHIQTLASKNYQGQFENAPDYVLMFVPGEHFIAAALEHDSHLWDYAFERRVLLASPTNLVAIARTISQVWRQAGLEREAREIGKLASDLYDSLAKTQDDLMKTGVHLGRAVNSFNDFARTYEGNVLSRARRLTEKHVKIGKREILDEVALVESAPRFADVVAPLELEQTVE